MDAHQGKGCKGNNSRKILAKAHELGTDTAFPRDLKHFALEANLESFNIVVIGSFVSIEGSDFW